MTYSSGQLFEVHGLHLSQLIIGNQSSDVVIRSVRLFEVHALHFSQLIIGYQSSDIYEVIYLKSTRCILAS